MISMFRFVTSVALALTALCSCAVASDPAEESYRINEAQRLDQIARQLDLNYRIIRQSGYVPRYFFESPFEPWPHVPGDIWGYPSPRPIEHPIGHESKQTGPNRWIYRPVYSAEMRAARVTAPAPPPTDTPRGLVAPPKPRPSDVAEPDAKPQRRGPREF